jgi:hypothetical protein
MGYGCKYLPNFMELLVYLKKDKVQRYFSLVNYITNFSDIKVPFQLDKTDRVRVVILWCMTFVLSVIPSLALLAQQKVLTTNIKCETSRAHKQNMVIVDSMEIGKKINQYILELNEASYLAAFMDTMFWKQDTLYTDITCGPTYKWITLYKGNVPQEAITSSGFREAEFEMKPFNPESYVRKAEKILSFFERNGYPFATLSLINIKIDTISIQAEWDLNLNPFITIDSIEIIGDSEIKPWFLHKYLGLRIGTAYNEQTATRIDSRLSQLPFVSTVKNATFYFYGNKAKPILFLNNRRSNTIDGIVGFAPNNQIGKSDLLITGEVNLKLQNLFGTGKSIDLNYRSFLGNSQDLRFRFVYPYILRSNIGLDYQLDLLKQDSTFLDVRNTIGAQYRFVGNDYVSFFYSIQTTTLISVDTNIIKNNRVLPDAADIRNDQYGIAIKRTHLDYFYNPRKGYLLDLYASIGSKKIIRNAAIDALVIRDNAGNPYNIYDSTNLSMVQYKIAGDMDFYLPIYSNFVWRIQFKGGYLVADKLFINELFRIGGIRSLKGFDEQAIFASNFMIANTELRYLIQKNAHVMLFWNGAYYENNAITESKSDTPFGLGAGINFETGAGVFSLYYALGKEQNNTLDFQRAKVHFGFINYF